MLGRCLDSMNTCETLSILHTFPEEFASLRKDCELQIVIPPEVIVNPNEIKRRWNKDNGIDALDSRFQNTRHQLWKWMNKFNMLCKFD